MTPQRDSLTLPPEIWLRVVEFITPEETKKLLGVNLAFYNAAMDLLYHEVALETRNTQNAMKIISRLASHSAAERVRTLTLRLTHVKLASGAATHPTSDPSQLKKQINDALNRVFKPISKYLNENPGRKAPSRTKDVHKATFYDVMNELVSIVPRFTSLSSFAVESWDLPPTYNLVPLYTAIWQSFGPRLHTLQFGGNLEGYRTFINSEPILTNLKTFRLEIINDIFRTNVATDHQILSDTLVPFINTLSPQLEGISIWSWANVNLSIFFNLLSPTFPVLNLFVILANFNIAFPDGGPTLYRFLSTSCPALKQVGLRLKPTGIIAHPTLENPLTEWLATALDNPQFLSNITHLDIYPTSLPPGMSTIRRCIDRIAPQLISFTVRDRYWTSDEVKEILELLSGCPKLRAMRLSTGSLTVALLDLIYEKVPYIQRLHLSIGYNVHETRDGEPTHFQETIKSRYYRNWKLEHLTLWQGGSEVDHTTMCAIASAIPTVWSFFDRGHMRPVPQ